MAYKKSAAVLRRSRCAEIDPPAGSAEKTVLPSAAVDRVVRRHRLIEILSRDTPAWDPADHPDIEKAGGAAAWVRKLRREADKASMRRIRSKRQ
jgi:hypothetical protein